MYSTTAGFGRTVPENELYLERPGTGMNLATIQAAHTVDVAVRVAGALAAVSVLPTVQYPADDTPFRLDVVGEDATLTLDGGAPRGFQSGVLRLRVDGQPVPVTDGATTAPTFADAVRLSHLLDDMLAVAASGATVIPTEEWPR